MFHEHARGHAANAARDGGDGVDDRLNRVEIGVAAQVARLVNINAHVEHRLTGMEEIATIRFRAARGKNHHIAFAHDGRQVARTRMACGHRRVAIEQKHAHGFANNQATPHDNYALARNGNVVRVEHLDARRRRAGSISGTSACKHRSHGAATNAVHIFRGIERIANGLLIELLGQRAEHETAVNRRVGVHPGDNIHKFFLGCIFRKRNGTRANTQSSSALERRAFIGQIVGARAHAHNRKTRLHAALFERSNAPLQFLSQRVNNGLSKQQFRHDGSFFFCGIRSMEPTLARP